MSGKQEDVIESRSPGFSTYIPTSLLKVVRDGASKNYSFVWFLGWIQWCCSWIPWSASSTSPEPELAIVPWRQFTPPSDVFAHGVFVHGGLCAKCLRRSLGLAVQHRPPGSERRPTWATCLVSLFYGVSTLPNSVKVCSVTCWAHGAGKTHQTNSCDMVVQMSAPCGCESKIGTQNGTLVNGNMD